MSENQTKPYHIYLIYMYKEDMALNNLQWLICQLKQAKLYQFICKHFYKNMLLL